MFIRTGPAELNVAAASRALILGGRMHAYGPHAFTDGGATIDCPDEASFAAWLGWPLLLPEQRTAEAARQTPAVTP